MTLAQIEKRLKELEKRVQALEDPQTPRSGEWWAKRSGMFANDPVYQEIVRRGRAYRESLRPKTRKKR